MSELTINTIRIPGGMLHIRVKDTVFVLTFDEVEKVAQHLKSAVTSFRQH